MLEPSFSKPLPDPSMSLSSTPMKGQVARLQHFHKDNEDKKSYLELMCQLKRHKCEMSNFEIYDENKNKVKFTMDNWNKTLSIDGHDDKVKWPCRIVTFSGYPSTKKHKHAANYENWKSSSMSWDVTPEGSWADTWNSGARSSNHGWNEWYAQPDWTRGRS